MKPRRRAGEGDKEVSGKEDASRTGNARRQEDVGEGGRVQWCIRRLQNR